VGIGAPGEGVTLDGCEGAVGEEYPFPPQATYPRANRRKKAMATSFFISGLLSVITGTSNRTATEPLSASSDS
jgi:hypothetical protein